ncbi:MAG TPA: CPBP family intramembrane glutamic endopeptidase [Planctomycetota bacterium]|nr:CPBP family intramembrane glutamic endopeptidase [Planctomycetota bacterium]
MPFAEIKIPDTLGLLFLAWILLGLPWAAIRSARRVREADSGKSDEPLPPRTSIWLSSIILLSVLFLFAYFVGGEFGYEIFAVPALGWREVLAAIGALLALFAIRKGLRASRSEPERRKLAVYKLAPRGAKEWSVWIAMVFVASISEEAAYRGVAMSLLWWSLGNPWIAAAICALAFAAAHWMQGWKSGVAIFAIALAMHGLVAFTQTLVLAMIVHAIYDIAAGYWIHRQLQADELADARAADSAQRDSAQRDSSSAKA